MPRVPTDYSKTCIYKLVHKEDFNNENIYIGSTTNFRKRKNKHKSIINKESNNDYNQLKYVYIRENGGWNQWNMIEIEKYPCNDKREAEAKEEYWRIHFNAVLNSKVCSSLTNNKTEYYKKYCENNKEKLAEKAKQYYENNKENYKEKKKIYYEHNKEKNKEKKNELSKQYREKNKEKITCECGCEIQKLKIKIHKQTLKHMKLMTQKMKNEIC